MKDENLRDPSRTEVREGFSSALERAAWLGARGPRRNRAVEPSEIPSSVDDLVLLLSPESAAERSLLRATAARVRDERCGSRMVLRALIEFSSVCGNDCKYCGLNRNNGKADRYRLTKAEILESAAIAARDGIRTVVLQSGEDSCDADWLADVVRGIKELGDIAVTLSVGERAREDYALWKEAGADRFLMRVETIDPELYASLHVGRRVETRLSCLDELQSLGYQTGSGLMVGPPGQTMRHIARDILFFAERDFDMIGIGPFIAHPETPFANAPSGDPELTVDVVALTRIATGNAWLPATTALGSLDRDWRIDALKAGANVVMPNYSPAEVKKKYEIYPGKRCVSERTGACAACMGHLAAAAGLKLDLSRADSLKRGGDDPARDQPSTTLT